VKSTLLATREPTLEEDSCEAVLCKIHIAGFQPLYNGCFYRKPDHHLEAVCGLYNAVSKVTSRSCFPNNLITGDFNLPHINWDLCNNENKYHMHNNQQYGTVLNQALLDMINHHSLSQCVKDPTRNSKILDQVHTTNPDLVKSTIICEGMSDHDLVVTELVLKIKPPKKKPRKIFLFKRPDVGSLRDNISKFRSTPTH